MIKKALSLFLLIQLSSYALPEWATSPMSFCPPTELCAVGEAAGSMGADAAARNEIAKIFSTKIKSNTSVVTTSESTSNDGVIAGDVSEQTYNSIQEMTEEIVEGSYIKEKFQSEDSYFSLAALHKRKTSTILEDRMSRIDTEMKSLIKDGRRSSLNKAIKLYETRNFIHDRYRILRNTDYTSSISLKTLLDLKKKKREMGVKVSLRVNELDQASDILKSVKENLIENDFIINSDMGDYRIEVKLQSEPQYMKVKGFVKNKFILSAKSFNNSNEEIGALKYEIIQTGRSFKQSYENALPGIYNYIKEKFNELNID
ncbi:LPP20 family lipoprotein [Halobacteriovorax marinus]|uniref:LPP20 family lipoprotein n=1 Tax=Halobacteriovorax marinus TaxID=97084 RepID=UPI003A8DA4E8